MGHTVLTKDLDEFDVLVIKGLLNRYLTPDFVRQVLGDQPDQEVWKVVHRLDNYMETEEE